MVDSCPMCGEGVMEMLLERRPPVEVCPECDFARIHWTESMEANLEFLDSLPSPAAQASPPPPMQQSRWPMWLGLGSGVVVSLSYMDRGFGALDSLLTGASSGLVNWGVLVAARAAFRWIKERRAHTVAGPVSTDESPAERYERLRSEQGSDGELQSESRDALEQRVKDLEQRLQSFEDETDT